MIDVGIHDNIPEAIYHGDSYSMPALSCGVIKDLLFECPQRAFLNHPALNPVAVEDDDEDRFDIGNAAHKLLLEGENAVEVLAFPNYRTNDAKDARSAAREAGKIPLLGHQWIDVQSMAEAAHVFLRSSELGIHDLPTEGKAEQSFVWVEDGYVFKARPDWIPNDGAYILDYKTTSATAHPDAAVRTVLNNGYDIQDWLYTKGAYTLMGKEMPFVFLFQEVKAPYFCSLVGLSPSFRELGMNRFERGLKLWQTCLATGEWPAYSDKVYELQAPNWAMIQEAMKDEEEEDNE